MSTQRPATIERMDGDLCALTAESHAWQPEHAFTTAWEGRSVQLVCPPGEAEMLVRTAERGGYFSRPSTMAKSLALVTRIAPVCEAIVAMGGREHEVGRALIAPDATEYVVARCWHPPCDGCSPTRAIFSVAEERVVASYLHDHLQGQQPLPPRLHAPAHAVMVPRSSRRLALAGLLICLEEPSTREGRHWPAHATPEGVHHAPGRTLLWRDPLTGRVELFEDVGRDAVRRVAEGDVPERHVIAARTGGGRIRTVVRDGQGRPLTVERARHEEVTRPLLDDLVRRWNEQVQLSIHSYPQLLRRV